MLYMVMIKSTHFTCCTNNKTQKFVLKFEYFLALTAENDTLEERVQLLEVQVTVIQENLSEIDEDVTLLDKSVNFLFDQQITQDERLLNLEIENSDLSSNVEGVYISTVFNTTEILFPTQKNSVKYIIKLYRMCSSSRLIFFM